MNAPLQQSAVDEVEIGLLLAGVRQVYGHDFSDYAAASLKRRLARWLSTSPFSTYSEAQSAILRDRQLFDSLVQGIAVNVTDMFRDPAFFQTLRQCVIPQLRERPFVNIWHAGCASGEEAYSMAILLHEAGMHGRYRLVATDINEAALRRARDGIFPLKSVQAFTRNYQQSGGSASFADYYTARYGHAIVMAPLRENLVFARHNLVADGSMGEMNLILCRNVMIYFQAPLKERCARLFDSSLKPGGFLCLGMKERLGGDGATGGYERFAPRVSIYRKSYG